MAAAWRPLSTTCSAPGRPCHGCAAGSCAARVVYNGPLAAYPFAPGSSLPYAAAAVAGGVGRGLDRWIKLATLFLFAFFRVEVSCALSFRINLKVTLSGSRERYSESDTLVRRKACTNQFLLSMQTPMVFSRRDAVVPSGCENYRLAPSTDCSDYKDGLSLLPDKSCSISSEGVFAIQLFKYPNQKVKLQNQAQKMTS